MAQEKAEIAARKEERTEASSEELAFLSLESAVYRRASSGYDRRKEKNHMLRFCRLWAKRAIL
ncbi:MAG: hypothetical protein KH334_05095 [Clostridiales bacterium]|nr:hypothetical protein [Clostridiales bacterium]